MRSQEILVLRSCDIFCNSSAISIQRAVKISENVPRIGKIKSSTRLIPVFPSIQHIAAKYTAYGYLLILQAP